MQDRLPSQEGTVPREGQTELWGRSGMGHFGLGWTPRPWRAFPALEGFSSLNDSMIPPVCPSPLGIRNHHISKHLQTQDSRNISPHCVPLSLVYFVPLETPCPDPPISIRDFAIPIIGDSLERSWLENISKNIKPNLWPNIKPKKIKQEWKIPEANKFIIIFSE